MHAVTPRHAASMRTTVMSARALRMPKEGDDRDGPLVEALRRRDADAAERLVTTYQSRAYRLAVGITANAEDAEEVVQDAFLSAVRKIDTFRGESAFRGSIASSPTPPCRRPDVGKGGASTSRSRTCCRNSTAMDVMPRLSSTGPPPSTIRPAISKYGSR